MINALVDTRHCAVDSENLKSTDTNVVTAGGMIALSYGGGQTGSDR